MTTARAELAIQLGNEAGRNAYLAAFHAARAFIFEQTGKVVKRHESVHREFHRLAKDEPAIDKSFPPFLTQGYNMKAIADYDTTPGSFVSPEEAVVAIETALRFVDCIRRVLTRSTGPAP
ncbi:MAG TPA: HEPN domain-containing protein [Bryobacteraceae bacterium]|nr:HEPN domain-containing protein [Bryobacteraceae bacterium]